MFSAVAIGMVDARDLEQISKIGDFVQKNSRGEDFPLRAEALLQKADYVVAAYSEGPSHELVGCACITSYRGCPDDEANTSSWFCCWLVGEAYRGRGIGSRIYRNIMSNARETIRTVDRALYASTDSEKAATTLTTRRSRWAVLSRGEWKKLREGKNEDGSPMTVWRYQL